MVDMRLEVYVRLEEYAQQSARTAWEAKVFKLKLGKLHMPLKS